MPPLEPTTPTSEVVQTVLLALKKAREHELREKLFVQINDGAHSATPFNNHQDLPLMAANAAYFTHRSDSCLDEVIGRTRFSSTELRVVKITPLADQLSVVELDICAGVMPEALFPELVDQRLTTTIDYFSLQWVLPCARIVFLPDKPHLNKHGASTAACKHRIFI